ncbi:glutathione S-transferase [Vibrio campbellii]|uniref:glutathione S-transferase n=1 Tax=Vibrio campbellii TaxID=680 RepID=UPI00396A6E5C
MLEASPRGSVPVFVISYPNLKAWLNGYIQSTQFSKVMKNYDLWLEERRDEFFGS